MSDLLVMEPNLWADFNQKKKMVWLIPFFAIWAFIVDWIDSMGLCIICWQLGLRYVGLIDSTQASCKVLCNPFRDFNHIYILIVHYVDCIFSSLLFYAWFSSLLFWDYCVWCTPIHVLSFISSTPNVQTFGYGVLRLIF